MNAVQLTEGIYCLPVNLESYQLFEGMWPMPNGISINSYIVRGEKTALIDLVEDVNNKPADFEAELASIPVTFDEIDYLVINHMEPDHTSWLPTLLQKNPDLTFYVTTKAADLLKSFYGVSENIHIVEDGESLELGAGKVLTFFETPNIHWPETMMTYEQSSKTLFSCDAFGSYGTLDDVYFDDQLSTRQHDFFLNEALRYYANIVSSFSTFVLKGIDRLEGLDIQTIAPSHGIIWRENPQAIIESYARFASYLKGPAEPEVTVIWSSMYGNTERLVKHIVQGVRMEGLPVHVYQVPDEHVGAILASAWKSAGLILGMPTYEYEMFPPMAWVLDMFRRKKIWNKKVLRFGSAGWVGGAQREFTKLTEGLKWDFIEPIEWKGAPTQGEFDVAVKQAQLLAKNVKAFCQA
ncbi:Flavorubredoxin [Malonomonas rubra DSM 5091]|uniref:Flavorubredoxin n=1 Tax=Malonomonas rubra DSM 5091 TaxID=1122189 RepID=A0A1M6DN36_MALRU|nr:FprA family A-type flavoprotein [Malonomonas rubra]SHI74714.1 Flavorubredoxin [Malonomonas rubra DSM 5091]